MPEAIPSPSSTLEGLPSGERIKENLMQIEVKVTAQAQVLRDQRRGAEAQG